MSDRTHIIKHLRCQRCRKPCGKRVIIENCTGTERLKVCLDCLKEILGKPAVKVIDSNVGRDM